MSSFSHQSYMRMWANELGQPIFSIDYRLAPEWQCPAALNDVWQAYYYLVEHGCKELGINGGKPPKKIIIFGDSAGGNLAAAITIMAIERKFRKPDGIVLAYPGNYYFVSRLFNELII